MMEIIKNFLLELIRCDNYSATIDTQKITYDSNGKPPEQWQLDN